MQRIQIRTPGGYDALELIEEPDPSPGPGEVLLDDAWLADLGLAVDLPQGLTLTLAGRNLFDETYLPSADDRAVPARTRAVHLGLAVRWN